MPGTPQTTIRVNDAGIRVRRMELGLSPRQLGEAVGVSRAYIAKLETGHSQRVSPEVFLKLVRALGLEGNDKRSIMWAPEDLQVSA